MDEYRFDRELRGNRNAPQHSRVVPLLSAFRHQQRFCFIFPWANGGNLRELWKSYSPLHVEVRGESRPAAWCTESWLLGECLGIAGALAAVHGFDTNSPRSAHPQIHADIKPDNILCFFSDTGGAATLKLADFGEAVRVQADSTTDGRQVAHVKSYRPPEHRPPKHSMGQTIGLNYDVWCLACLYLDLITWYLTGWDGVDAFSNNRFYEEDGPAIADADLATVIQDTFFKRAIRTRIPTFGFNFICKSSLKAQDRVITRRSVGVLSSLEIEYVVKDAVSSVSLILLGRTPSTSLYAYRSS